MTEDWEEPLGEGGGVQSGGGAAGAPLNMDCDGRLDKAAEHKSRPPRRVSKGRAVQVWKATGPVGEGTPAGPVA